MPDRRRLPRRPHDATLVEDAGGGWVVTFRDRDGTVVATAAAGGHWMADAVLTYHGLTTISGWKSWDGSSFQANVVPLDGAEFGEVLPTGAFVIRPFELDDLEAVVALWRECDLVRPQNDPVRD